MIISPQTVSPEIAVIESRQSTVIVERNDRNLEESGETEADRNVFAKILSRLLKNARDDAAPAGLEPGGPKNEEGRRRGAWASDPTGRSFVFSLRPTAARYDLASRNDKLPQDYQRSLVKIGCF